jgi:hypothetical protein
MCAGILGVLGLLTPVFIQAADIPLTPYVEALFPNSEPLSLFCLPDGTGNPPAEAFNTFGQRPGTELSAGRHLVDG